MMIEVDKLKNYIVKEITLTEKMYDEYIIRAKIELAKKDKWVQLKKRNDDTLFSKDFGIRLMKEYGLYDKTNIHDTFIHDPRLWEEDIGEFDGYYGDGLDHIEELYYMD